MNSNENADLEQFNGGSLTRVTFGRSSSEAAPSQAAPSARVHGEVTRFNFGGEAAETTSKTATYAHSTAGVTGGSVLSTLDRQGTAQTVELIPGVPSSRTTVAAALRDGLLVRDAAGNLQDAPDVQQKVEAMQQGPEQKQPQEADPGAGVFDATDDADWNAAIEPLPQPAYDAAVAGGISAVLGSGDLEQTAKALAANAGIEPELARQYVDEGSQMYQRVVDRSLAPLGLEGDRLQEAYAFMRESPQRLQDAIQRLVHTRDPGGFKELALDFRVARPDSAQLALFKSAGMETRVDRDTGDIMVRVGQGGWRRGADLLKAPAAPTAPATAAAAPVRTPAGAPKSSRMVPDPVTGNDIPEHWLT
jgi:hypothetical protein